MSSAFPIGVATRYSVPFTPSVFASTLSHASRQQGCRRNGNQQPDKSEEVPEHHETEDQHNGMQADLRPDDLRTEHGGFQKFL